MSSVGGELASIGVPDLFRAVANERKTGCLTLTQPNSEARVYFRDGRAYHARLVGSGVRLGTRMMSAGMLTQDELDTALAIQKTQLTRKRLGEILLDEEMVQRRDLERIVRQQMEDTIFEVLRWEGGDFRFDTDVLSDEDIGIQVAVENLVLEGARRFREWHQITLRVGTLDAIPRFPEEPADPGELTSEEWALMSKVDGQLTVAELAPLCGFTELEAARTVYSLVVAGVLEVELPTGFELPQDDPELAAVFDELETALSDAAKDRGFEDEEVTVEQIPSVGQAHQVTADTLEEVEGWLEEQAAGDELLVPTSDEIEVLPPEPTAVETAVDLAEVEGWLEEQMPEGEAEAPVYEEVPRLEDDIYDTAQAAQEQVAEMALPPDSGQTWLDEAIAQTPADDEYTLAPPPNPPEANGAGVGDLEVGEVLPPVGEPLPAVEEALAPIAEEPAPPALPDPTEVQPAAAQVDAPDVVRPSGERIEAREETIRQTSGFAVARIFAELSAPGRERQSLRPGDAHISTFKPEPDENQSDDDAAAADRAEQMRAQSAAQTSTHVDDDPEGRFDQPRPVDPAIDTTALWRELSDILVERSDDQESGQDPGIAMPDLKPKPSQEGEKKSGGLFGRKKK